MARRSPTRYASKRNETGGWGTALGFILLLGFVVKYWYVALGLFLLVVIVGSAARSEQRRKELEQRRHQPGPRDPWLNEIAVALAELGLVEVARNTGRQLCGALVEGDIGLQEERLLVYVNLFASGELARQAEIGLRAQPKVREAVANGRTALQRSGPVLIVGDGRGGVVDEFRMSEVARVVGRVPLPPPLSRPAALAPSALVAPAAHQRGYGDAYVVVGADPLEQIRKLAALRDAGLLSEEEFETKKAELLRRI
jgi:hypothetical protein